MTISTFKEKARPLAGLLLVGLAALLFLSVLRASIFSEVGEDKRIWFELSFLPLAAISAELLVVYLKQPVVMVLLLLGVAISPSTISTVFPLISGIVSGLASVFGLKILLSKAPSLVSSEGIVRVFAQLGSILLLFKIGLHSETKEIFNLKNLTVGLMGVIVPFAAGFYYASLTGHGLNYAMFLGAALTATSVGVTVAVLEEMKLLKNEFAKVILGAAVVDDILALLILSLVQNVPSSLSLAELSPFLAIVATAIIFVVGGIGLGKIIVLKYFDGKISGKSFFLGALVFVLAYAYVAEFIGLSSIVGAFIAGISLNYSKATAKLFELFYPLEAFFTPFFFISLGLLVDLPAIFSNLVPIIAITAIAIATKVIGCGIAAKATGSSLKDSLLVGVGMMPRGEIALIIGLYGLTALTAAGTPVLGPTEYSVIAAMAFLTTIIAPVAIQKTSACTKILEIRSSS